jgi:hypothetical protein
MINDMTAIAEVTGKGWAFKAQYTNTLSKVQHYAATEGGRRF